VTEVEGIPLEFANLRVFCSLEGDATGAVEVATTGNEFSVTLADGDSMICDSYSIPENLSGLTPTPGTGTTPTPAVQLPNTGSGFGGGSGSLGLLSFLMVAIGLGIASLALVRRPLSKRVRSDR
jgi:hypothetical protein